MDLFEQYETLPAEVNDIIADFDHLEQSYNNCAKLVEELNKVGYTCEYGLDAIPYGLRKIIEK